MKSLSSNNGATLNKNLQITFQLYTFNQNENVSVKTCSKNTICLGDVKRIYNYIKDESFFCLTYGDGLADVNINEFSLNIPPGI